MTHLFIHYPEPQAAGEIYQIKPDDAAHFQATVNRALTFVSGNSDVKVRCVEIYLRERTEPKTTTEGKVYDEGGWLEHAIVVNYEGPANRRLCIGAIQRTVGAQSEFHS